MAVAGFRFYKPSVQRWVRIAERDPLDEEGIVILGTPKGNLAFMYADIPGQGWDNNRLQMWVNACNDLLATRTDRATLPADHPYVKDGDPGLPWLYWDGADVVEQLVIVENATYSDEAGLNFEVKSLRNNLGLAVG